MSTAENLGSRLETIRAISEAYDSGKLDEALKLAGPLAEIFHSEKDAPGLLFQAGGRFAKLLSTVGKIPERAKHWPALTVWSLSPSNSAWICLPKGKALKVKREVASDFWWSSETIYKADLVKVRRRDLVLSAARAAGLRSPLAEATEERAWLCDGRPWIAMVETSDASRSRDVTVFQGHTASLRQIAHEVLNSPDLLKLAQR